MGSASSSAYGRACRLDSPRAASSKQAIFYSRFVRRGGGAGAYTNLQMGVSHTALAYVQDGKVRHLDVPLTEEYLGRQLRGELTGQHYQTLQFIHVVRPRRLSDIQRANIATWASRVRTMAHRIYPHRLRFNPDYNTPKYRQGAPNAFVATFDRILLGQKPTGALDMFCSEFVWALWSNSSAASPFSQFARP
jgi:hypothetical protein